MERLDIDLTVNPDTAHLYEELREAREEIARLRAENERIAAWAVRNLEDWLDHNGRQFAEQLWAACAVAALLAKPVCCHTPMVHQGYFTWRCERCGREARR